MNDVEVTKVKKLWGNTGGTWRTAQWLRWLQHPTVQERINRLATGDLHKDRYQYFLEHCCTRRFGRRTRVKRALTLGCGHGEFERGLSRYNFAEIHEGIDIADGAVAEAIRLAKAEGLEHLRYRVGDLNTIELPECTYDVVFGISAIHHVAQLAHLFREVLGSLKPGGYFLLDEFVGASQFQWSDEQLAIINEQLAKLPVEFKYAISDPSMVKGCVWKQTVDEMNAYDPSEAIRSGEIMELLPRYFDIVEVKGYGGTLLHLLLDEIAGNFVPDDPRSMEYLRSFFDLEDQMIASGKFQHDFAMIIARRKPTRVHKIFGRQAAYIEQNLKSMVERELAKVPPVRRWLSELETLRGENGLLKRDLRSSKNELDRIQRTLWVPPGHFHSPIPAVRDLKVNQDEVFDLPPAVRGVDLNEMEQVDLVKEFGLLYPEQPFMPGKTSGRRYLFENPNYSYADAITLYCMIRHLRPKRIIEIGSGYSSCAMLDVNELFFDNAIQCTFIDPYPQLLRTLMKESDFARTRIIGQRVQDVDVGIFRELEASDILFIDSSHVAKTGSDVNYILFKILPLLVKGVHIHFHDIFYPFEYPRGWVFEGRAWNEAYLLRAFLQYNSAFKIRFFMTYLLQNHRSTFESRLPLCLLNTGGSLWLEKVEQNPGLERLHAPTARKARPVPTKIEPFHPENLWLLGEGWYGGEETHCWMEQEAVLRLAGPAVPGRKLAIRGYSPHADGAQLSASADGIDLGTVRLEVAGHMEAEFSLPASLVGKTSIEVRLSVDRVCSAPKDPRKLGLSIKMIEII